MLGARLFKIAVDSMRMELFIVGLQSARPHETQVLSMYVTLMEKPGKPTTNNRWILNKRVMFIPNSYILKLHAYPFIRTPKAGRFACLLSAKMDIPSLATSVSIEVYTILSMFTE